MNEAGFSKIAILILAAGRSSRMGRPKQLLSWKKTTLIGNAVAIASSLTNHFLVVLGANALKIKPYVPEGKATLNEKWQEGMGSSLSHGVTALASKYEPRAILVMVADQPLLELEHYKGLIRSHQNNPNKICSSSYGGIPGVPAIFPELFFKELKKLGADFGAKKLMKTLEASVVMIETRGELIDLDTPEDYSLASSRLGE